MVLYGITFDNALYYATLLSINLRNLVAFIDIKIKRVYNYFKICSFYWIVDIHYYME